MSLFGQTVNSRGKTGLFEPITLARRCIDCHALRELAADTADTVEEFLSKPTQDVTQSCNHSGRESRFRNSAMCNQGRQLTLVVRIGAGKHVEVMHAQSHRSRTCELEGSMREMHGSKACFPKLHRQSWNTCGLAGLMFTTIDESRRRVHHIII